MIKLLELWVQVNVSFELQRGQLVLLDRYTVKDCYTGEYEDTAEARLAVETAKVVPAMARAKPALAR